jgi:CBS domain-containing protein
MSEPNPAAAKVKAADVMTANPRTCSPFSTVLEAVLLFRDADCGAVPVLDDGKPVGVLTDRDVALALAEHEQNLSALPVSEIMSQGAVTVAPDATLDLILDQFGDRSVRRLLVVDAEDRLQGIIGWADVAPYASVGKLGQAVSKVVEQSE